MKTLTASVLLQARKRRGILALFDLDGTLSPIAATPEEATVPDLTKKALMSLARRSDAVIGIVSGRPLREVRRMIGRRGFWLAGLHGYCLASPDGNVNKLWSREEEKTARHICRLLERELPNLPGARVELKGPITAFHTRLLPGRLRDSARRLVMSLCPPDFNVIEGRRVFEFRPADSPTKFDAVRWLMKRFDGKTVLYAGDDTTDEDAFRALGRGDFSVFVGGARARAERRPGRPFRTRARWLVPSPLQLGKILQKLAEAR